MFPFDLCFPPFPDLCFLYLPDLCFRLTYVFLRFPTYVSSCLPDLCFPLFDLLCLPAAQQALRSSQQFPHPQPQQQQQQGYAMSPQQQPQQQQGYAMPPQQPQPQQGYQQSHQQQVTNTSSSFQQQVIFPFPSFVCAELLCFLWSFTHQSVSSAAAVSFTLYHAAASG